MIQQTWDVDRYQNQHSFVWHYGQGVLEWLRPQPGERILDLGCGAGQLTQQLAQGGCGVDGIDADPAMVAQAQQNYPHLTFHVADACNFSVPVPYDAVFSNAVLHWIPTPEAVIRCVYQALKPGGRFVAEFGGQGNVQTIIAGVEAVLGRSGLNFWYFPSIATYAGLLESAGFEVTDACLFDRPTELTDGDRGLANWLNMFGRSLFPGLDGAATEQAIEQVEQLLSPKLYRGDHWIADYRRLRIKAIKL